RDLDSALRLRLVRREVEGEVTIHRAGQLRQNRTDLPVFRTSRAGIGRLLVRVVQIGLVVPLANLHGRLPTSRSGRAREPTVVVVLRPALRFDIQRVEAESAARSAPALGAHEVAVERERRLTQASAARLADAAGASDRDALTLVPGADRAPFALDAPAAP